MKLEIDQALAQKILDHLVTSPTGSTTFKEVNDMIQGLVSLKPVIEKPKRVKKDAP